MPASWDAWRLDPGTWAVIVWLVWFLGWETWAVIRGSYLDTFTAHLRPVFLAWPVTWWVAFGLWLWIGVHMLAPAVERELLELVRG